MVEFPFRFTLLILLLLVLGSACPNRITGGYVVKEGKVVYHHGMKGMGQTRSTVVKDADPATFEVLDRFYGRDESRAYYDGEAISGSDGPTFKIIETPYTSDRNHVYFSGIILSNNPDGFRILFKTKHNRTESTFSTDGTVVFKGAKQFFPDVVDSASFERIGKSNYFRDKARVYAVNRQVEGADPKTFEVTARYSGRYARDRNAIYYNGIRVPGADRETHELIDDVHHRDATKVFFAMEVLGEDPDNFTILSRAYSKDSTAVYWRWRKFSEDPAGFVFFPSERSEAYAKDSKQAFYCWEPIEGADVPTFVGLNRNYAKDKNRVYFAVSLGNPPSVIEGADPQTFALVKGQDGIDARDKNMTYNFGWPRRKNKRRN